MLTTDLSTGTNYFSATLPLWIRQDTSESKPRWNRCLPSTPVAERTHTSAGLHLPTCTGSKDTVSSWVPTTARRKPYHSLNMIWSLSTILHAEWGIKTSAENFAIYSGEVAQLHSWSLPSGRVGLDDTSVRMFLTCLFLCRPGRHRGSSRTRATRGVCTRLLWLSRL